MNGCSNVHINVYTKKTYQPKILMPGEFNFNVHAGIV